MNTGERLTSLSGLSPRSAFDHFMAITAGSGPGKTIFASQMTVVIEAQEVVAHQPRSTQRTQIIARPAQQFAKTIGKRTDIRRAPPSVWVLTKPDVLYLRLAGKRTYQQLEQPKSIVTHRKTVTNS